MPGRRRHLPSACTISLLMAWWMALSIVLAYIIMAPQHDRPNRAKVMVTIDDAWALGTAIVLYLAQDCRLASSRCHSYH